MKVYLLEAVDPEDRKVRVHHLYKKANLLRAASGMAHKAGNRKESKRLWLKSQRFKFAGMRDTQSYRQVTRLYKQAGGDKKPEAPAKGKGYDPEDRSVRVFKLRKHADMLRRAADNNLKLDANPEAAAKKLSRANRADSVARAYGGRDPKFKSQYKNVHGEEIRKLARTPGAEKALDTKLAKDPSLGDRIKPGLRAKSKINKTDRAQRILDLVNAGTRARLASRASIRGDHDAAARLAGPTITRKYFATGRKGDPHTGFSYGMLAQKAHTLAAKFLKTPGKRDKYNKALKRLRVGHANVGIGRDWKKMQNPLSHLGVKTQD